jgi:DNA-binding NarL/FixJ family response regulator
MLQSEKDWEVCGEAGTGREAVALNATQQPDLVVLDLSMPELTGLQAAKLIHEQSPETDIILLTMHEFFELMEELHTLGIRTCILKTELQQLVSAVREVHQARSTSRLAARAASEANHISQEHSPSHASKKPEGT